MKKIITCLSFILMAFILIGCTQNDYVSVSIQTGTGQTVTATGSYTLNVYDEEDHSLYNIKVLSSTYGDSNSTLKTHSNETIVVYLEIYSYLYSNENFSMEDVYLTVNGTELISSNEWDYIDSCEFQYIDVSVGVDDLVFSVQGVSF